MKDNNLTIKFAVDQTPDEVFAAVNNVRGWWSETLKGKTDRVGAEFVYRHKDLHVSTQKVVELVPGRKVVWRVLDGEISFVKNKSEWNGTEIVFEIAREKNKTELQFTHVGLTPALECHEACSGGWKYYIDDSLRRLITTGKGEPDTEE